MNRKYIREKEENNKKALVGAPEMGHERTYARSIFIWLR